MLVQMLKRYCFCLNRKERGIEMETKLKQINDPYMEISQDGKEYYFGVEVPDNYYVDRNGVWITTKKSPQIVCRIPIMITKRFYSNGVDMIEMTFVDDMWTGKDSLQVPIIAFESLNKWRKYVRRNLNARPGIIDWELPHLRKFFKAILQTREICVLA